MAHIFTDSQVHEYSLIRGCFCLLIFTLFLQLSAQQAPDKKVDKLIQKADQAVENRDFAKARTLLHDAIQRNPSYARSYEKMFTALKVSRKDDEIHDLQLKYIDQVPAEFLDKRVWRSLASYEFSKGNYVDAQEFLKKSDSADDILSKSIEFSLKEIANPKSIELNELPNEVNGSKFQYLPVLTIDKRTMLFTSRKGDNSDEDILISYLDDSWTTAQSISDRINTPYNEGACTISADGRILVFTACEGRGTFGNCDLYMATRNGDEWTEGKNLGKNVNSRFWDSQPSLSADGRTLFFVSNRPGGIGGRDIWVTELNEGVWLPAKNLGPIVNTSQDDTTPFIHADGKSLFFSSNGHIGLGGFDLLKSRFENNSWSRPENLGYPLNTFHDEVSLFVTSDGLDAYFAKEESTGSKVNSSRIFTYSLKQLQNVPSVKYLTGHVFDAKTKMPLEADIELINLTDESKAYQTSSDAKNGSYFFVLPPGTDYGAFVEKQGYLFEELSFSVDTSDQADSLNFYLKPIESGASMILKNIYFAFNSDELNTKSTVELQKLAELMKANPNIQIEVSGHTDNVGTKHYNIDLSERRARRVYEQLITLGVNKNRLSWIGLGDTQPIASNSTENGRASNRRIEFRIK